MAGRLGGWGVRDWVGFSGGRLIADEGGGFRYEKEFDAVKDVFDLQVCFFVSLNFSCWGKGNVYVERVWLT